jgi:HAD superfamily hydrolase (TIGR01509 family)
LNSIPLHPGLALIFDMDGVLIESTAIHTQAWIEYLRRLDIPSDGILERMHGKRNDQIVRDIWNDSLSAEEVFAHGAAKERLYRELMAPELESRLVPGVREFLAGSSGVPRAVASNAEPANLEFVLQGAGLGRHFSVRIDGQQATHPKPDPEVFLLAAERLGVRPGACIVFEDSEAGVEAARRAGMRAAGIETTLRPVPDCGLSVRDFRDPRLLPWLTSLQPL